MSDKYLDFANTPFGKKLLSNLGLPTPVRLSREDDNQPQRLSGDVLLGFSDRCEFESQLMSALKDSGMKVLDESSKDSVNGLVFDASGIASAEQSAQVYAFFHQHIRRLSECGRVVLIGRTPETIDNSQKATLQRGLIGFVKSVGKEIGRRGATANLLLIGEDGEKAMEEPLRFFLSRRSAFVSGQQLIVNKPVTGLSAIGSADFSSRPLSGKVVVVTGAARGLGLATCQVFARDGARVVGVDIPESSERLKAGMDAINGLPLPLDITDQKAPSVIMDYCRQQAGGLDIVVHNAGVTRDKTLAKMTEEQWNGLMEVNLASIQRINNTLLATELLDQGGRIIMLSSVSGIAGNVGQTNYALSKAALIGIVENMAAECAERGITINAIAPGFIDTEMSAAIPFVIRQVSRRMSSLGQGGLPKDVAEAIAFLANPQAAGVNGSVLRVCGQLLLGA